MRRCARVVICADDAGALEALDRAGGDAVRYGSAGDADVRLEMTSPGPGGARGRVTVGGSSVPLELRIDGAHNLLDAAAAVAVGGLVGVPPATAAAALASFGGVHRRFEHRGRARGADFVDDYAQVPREIAVTLEVARARQPGRLIAVIQPHRYWRTRALWRELGASVTAADLVVVMDVYGAEQDPMPGVTGALVVEGVRLAAPEREVVYTPHHEETIEFLTNEVRPGDLVVTLGCGDVWMVADGAIERIGERDGDG
jgi:UDP-N-acetylmuramate--alanine ligase